MLERATVWMNLEDTVLSERMLLCFLLPRVSKVAEIKDRKVIAKDPGEGTV